MNNTSNNKQRRAKRIRGKVYGTTQRPRLTVSRSNKGMYAQIVDDTMGKTLIGINLKEVENKTGTHSASSGSMTKTDQSKTLGLLLAEKAKKQKISTVVFDKGSYKYHGRVKAFAEGAREGGLEF